MSMIWRAIERSGSSAMRSACRARAPGHRDWHNDYAELLLEINDAMEAAAGRNAKGVIIRRIRDALRDGARE